MTETHTPYQRGRRAAERGAPREVPTDLKDVAILTLPPQYPSEDWLKGYDSIYGTRRTEDTASARGTHYQAGQFQAWDVTRYMSGDLAQAWQYVYRCGRKGSEQDAIVDLQKAVDFIEDWQAHNDVPTFDLPYSAWKVIFTIETTLPTWKRLSLGYIVAASVAGSVSAAISAKKIIRTEIARREAV